jgi:hypothetical protein
MYPQAGIPDAFYDIVRVSVFADEISCVFNSLISILIPPLNCFWSVRTELHDGSVIYD